MPHTTPPHLSLVPTKRPGHPPVTLHRAGKTYDTRTAEFIHGNDGDYLYFDREAGYFLAGIARPVGGEPRYVITPLVPDLL